MTPSGMTHIGISNHAIDRASQRCLGVWEETARPGEGLFSWLRRTAAEALASADGAAPAAVGETYAFLHHDLCYILKRTNDHRFRLVTVINKKPSPPRPASALDAALGQAFLEWVADGIGAGYLLCGEGAAAQPQPDGILLRYPALFRAFGEIQGVAARQVKDSFLLLGLHAIDPQGRALQRRSPLGGGTPFRGVLLRDGVLPPPTAAPARAAVPPSAGLGRAFLEWAAAGVRSGGIAHNSPGARVHGVAEGVLLASPGIFQDCAAALGVADFRKVQRAFLKLGLHRRTPAGADIHRYTLLAAARPGLNGLLLPDPARVFGDAAPPLNPWLEPAGHLTDAEPDLTDAEPDLTDAKPDLTDAEPDLTDAKSGLDGRQKRT